MAVKCGNCNDYHPSRVEVRACFAAKAGLAESRAIVREAKAPAPKVPTHETFGQTMRRRAASKPSCWACDSTDIEYRVLKGKQLLCCDKHPKTSHPDYVAPSPELVQAVETRDLRRRQRAAKAAGIEKPNPRSKLVNGRRVFREGCEPGKYEGLEHSADVTRCGRCAGTGMFITGSMNGKPTGPGGPCFRCAGKARQTCCTTEVHAARYEAIMSGDLDDISACCDVVRNDLYDRFAIKIGAF